MYTKKFITGLIKSLALFVLIQNVVAQEDSLRLLHVQDQVYMLYGGDVNVTVQIGDNSLVLWILLIPRLFPR